MTLGHRVDTIMADRRAELERKRKMLADLRAKKETTRDQRDPSRDRSIPGIPDMRIETEDLLKSLGLGKYQSTWTLI